MSIYGSKIKELRNNRGLSQKDLAKILGFSTSAVAMYEMGKREPNFEKLKIIAAYFKVDCNYLLGFDSPFKGSLVSCDEKESQINSAKNKENIKTIQEYLINNPETIELFVEVMKIEKEDIPMFEKLIEKLN